MENEPVSHLGPEPISQPRWIIHYRRMNLLDVPQVHAIDRCSFSMPWPERSYQYELTQNPNSILWVAEARPVGGEGARRIAGMIVVWIIIEEAHVATIATHPDFRGLGVGKMLLALGLRESIQRGASESTLEVRESNLVAQNLYAKFGYREAGRRPRYYRDNNEDALLLTVYGLDAEYLKWLETLISGG